MHCEMIERVAKALMSVNDAHPGQEHWSDEWEDRARAAIEAMREPTDKMIAEAMIQPLPSVAEAGGVLEQGRAAARIEWQAMIDAALTKPERPLPLRQGRCKPSGQPEPAKAALRLN